jgi:hypothetical protein
MPTVETVLNVASTDIPNRKSQFEADGATVNVVANLNGASALKASYNDGSVDTVLNVASTDIPNRKSQFEADGATVDVVANQPNASAIVATYQ